MTLGLLTRLAAQRPLALGALVIVWNANGHENGLVAAQTNWSTVHFGARHKWFLAQNYLSGPNVSGRPKMSPQS